jgi:hypothetical protein
MKFNLTVLSPINKSSAITEAGTSEKMTVRLSAPADSSKKAVNGISLRPGCELTIVITDPTQFDTFKPGQTVSVTLE